MKILKKIYYEKIIYPKFIENVKKVWEEKNILIRLKMEEEEMSIYYVIDNKILKLSKNTNGNLIYNETNLDNLIGSEIYSDLIEFINDFKLNGEIVSSQNIIDFISNSFKDAIKYYKLSRKDYELIYSTILKYQDFFLLNTPALVIHNEGIKNKWID